MRWIALATFGFGALVVGSASGCVSNDGLPCSVTTDGSAALGNMEITLDTPSCTMTAGTGALLSYTITTQQAVSFMYGPHAGCTPTEDNPSSFTAAEVTGQGGEFCPTCDVGTCGEDPGEMITIPAGSYPGSLNFPGREWDGPAGSGVPIGGNLPAGAYTAKVIVTMPVGTLEADLGITLD